MYRKGNKFIRIFDYVQDTFARKSSGKLALFSRLIRIFGFAQDTHAQ